MKRASDATRRILAADAIKVLSESRNQQRSRNSTVIYEKVLLSSLQRRISAAAIER
jgi:hypothetical protein